MNDDDLLTFLNWTSYQIFPKAQIKQEYIILYVTYIPFKVKKLFSNENMRTMA